MLAMLAKLWPSGGHLMTESGGFRPLSEKVFTQSKCVLIGWMFRIDSHLGHVGPILVLKLPQTYWKRWFPTIIWRSTHAIQFKLNVYICWVSVQIWFAFRPCCPNSGPLVAHKWLELLVSDCFLKKYSCNTIESWFLHLLVECSQLICIWTTLAKFRPSSGHKMTENGVFPIIVWKITQSISNMVFILVRGVFKNDSIFLLHRPNLAPLLAISVFPFLWLGLRRGRESSDALYLHVSII